jgi:chaperonin cofactor prefoldin
MAPHDDDLIAKVRARLQHHQEVQDELKRRIDELERRCAAIRQENHELRQQLADSKWSLEP